MIKSKQHKPYKYIKRGAAARLFGDYSITKHKEYKWVDDETDFAILLQAISERKLECKLERNYNQQITALKERIKALESKEP